MFDLKTEAINDEFFSGLEPEVHESDSTRIRKAKLSENEERIHARAKRAVESFKRSEAAVMEALIEVEASRVYAKLGYSGLYQYALHELGLSEAVAYTAVSVSKKAAKVESLREAIQEGELGLSKARKALSVIQENAPKEDQEAWVKKAIELPTAQLEKEVVKVNPKAATPEKAIYVSSDRLDLRFGVTEELLKKFKRAQDLVSRSKRENASLEATLDAVLEFYLERRDPERVAARNRGKSPEKELGKAQAEKPSGKPSEKEHPKADETKKTNPSGKAASVTHPANHDSAELRTVPPIPDPSLIGYPGKRLRIVAELKHEVLCRDHGACQERNERGEVCGSRRWIEVHHVVPIARGGENRLENLITLCSFHHRARH